MVLTNQPFGKKSSVTIVNEAGDEEKQSLVVHRDDFWASTSNKQLNFLQHILIRDIPSLTRYLAGLSVYPHAAQHRVFTIFK
jgi:hypothetical protein